MNEGTWTIEPCERDAVATLARELSLSPTTAAVLVRRGYEDVAGARGFLEGALPAHDPFGLGDMAAACEAIRAAVAEGRRICVHGDYDADGICATTLAVLVLRELGADVDWHLPSRFGELCGTGVVFKLGQALLGADSEALLRHLDLVGIATIADVVPLVDENRGLAIAALRALASTQKPGLRELMKVARVDPATADAASVGFRLAPRLNAAGRLGHPEAALELLLTEDPGEAGRLAHRLDELNRDRQTVEERILREAVEEIESWPEAKHRQRGYVLARAEWHEGVIGIVASRLVERYHRPVVLIAGAELEWKGSGRSTGSFDLHAGLAACSGQLIRFGGHRAAAGLSIEPAHVEAFSAAFAAYAGAHLSETELLPVTVIDALVHGSELTLDLCADLARLAPFGLGNPGVTLLAAGCGLGEVAAVGDGKHLRFRVKDGSRDAGSAIAFGFGRQLDRFRQELRFDIAFRLEENHWNGTVAPQLVVRRVFDGKPRYRELRDWQAGMWREQADAWPPEAAAIFAELELGANEARRRHLLESANFRRLLEVPSGLAEAA